MQQGSIINGNRSSNIIFLDALGGTGKSFVINTILKKIRSGGKIALATASSGIAATLLQGGRTLHSTFKIPLDTHLKEQPTCNIKCGTALAKVIKDAAAIIVDEAPITHKSAYEAVDAHCRTSQESSNPWEASPHCSAETSGRSFQWSREAPDPTLSMSASRRPTCVTL